VNWQSAIVVEWLPNLANAATALGGVVLLFALIPFRQAQKQRLRDAEQWYVERYWAIQDRIDVKIVGGRLQKLPTDKDLYDELRLCEDELDLRRAGFITNSTWDLWSPSILAIKDSPEKLSVLDQADEMTLLREYLQTSRDPISIGVITATVRGLG
jgi:hypothetical protein